MDPNQLKPRHHLWPWLLLAAVLVGIGLAILWMSHEVERTRRIRDANLPAPASTTNQP